MRNRFDTLSVTSEYINHDWVHINAEGKTLGRLASGIVNVLRGKGKAIFQPNMNIGDYVVVTNVDKIRVTGKKFTDKIYYAYTGYPGNLKSVPYKDMFQKHPDRVLKLAVGGMLPHGRLGRELLGKLKIYAGADHPHLAQQPTTIEI